MGVGVGSLQTEALGHGAYVGPHYDRSNAADKRALAGIDLVALSF